MRSCPSKNVLPVICFWVSVEFVSFSSCRALAIPPQCWTSSLMSWSLNTRFLRAPAAAWLTSGLGLRSRVTRAGIPPSWKTCDTEMCRANVRLKGMVMDCQHCRLEPAAMCDDKCLLLPFLQGRLDKGLHRALPQIVSPLQDNSHTNHLCVHLRRVCLYGIFVAECSDLLFGALLFEGGVVDEGGSTLLVILFRVRQELYGLL